MRSNVRTAPTLRFARIGDRLHAGIQAGDEFVWVVYNRTLSEEHRTSAPALRGLLHGERAFRAFGVQGDRAIVVTEEPKAYVLGSHGNVVGQHDCRPFGFVGAARTRLVFGESLVILVGLTDAKVAPALCALSDDSPFVTLRRVLAYDDEVFNVGTKLYLAHAEDRIAGLARRLDKDLLPEGPAVSDPRPRLPPESCDVTGDIPANDFWLSGVDVVLSLGCCGPEPGGLFFCVPRGQVPPPPDGTPGHFLGGRD